MDIQQIKRYVNIQPLIEDFTNLPFTAMTKFKIAGKKKDKAIDFTDEEKLLILKGLKEVVKIFEKSSK